MDTLKPDYVSRKYPYTTLMSCEFYNHKHSFWEFIICISGNANHFVNEKKYPFTVGDIIMMKPDCAHNYKIPNKENNNYMHYDFYVTGAEMKRACDYLSPKLYERLITEKEPICFSLDTETLEMLKVKLNQLNSVQMIPIYEKYASNIYITILNFICGLMIEKQTATSHQIPDWLSKLMSDMSKPEILCGDLSALIKQSNYTHSHLSRIFKQQTGVTLIEYFTRLKIDYANILLRNNNLNIIDIALTLGYDSPSHFIQVFKKYNNTTPRQYRKDLYGSSKS